jgi:hypothetical protein
MSKREIKLLPFHPLADKFPLVEGEDFDAIVADIKQNGQRVPIHVYEGQIIDGRTRALACQKLGIAPKAWQPERQGADEPLSAGQLAKLLDELSPERFEEVMLALRPPARSSASRPRHGSPSGRAPTSPSAPGNWPRCSTNSPRSVSRR